MNLLFRTDASVEIGTGHVMRCLALAQAWQDAGGRAVFAMAESTAAIADRLRLENIEVRVLEAKAAGREDARKVGQIARDCGADWVVIDGYQFGADYQRELKSAGLSLLVADDVGIKDCVADIILNQNSNASEALYPGRGNHTRILLGTRYVLLRRDFWAWRDYRRNVVPTARRLLVTMGGSDPDNVTGLVIQVLGESATDGLRAVVVAGGSNPHLSSLREAVARLGGRIELKESVANMPEIMADADMAVIAAGGTLWELLYMSCPVMSFARNAVQGAILADLARREVVHYFGNPCEVAPATVALAIDKLAASADRRANMARLGREEVDGQGACRVCEAISSS